MQETRNNCFESKKLSMTLLQGKTGKHESQNVTATYTAAITFIWSLVTTWSTNQLKTVIYRAMVTQSTEVGVIARGPRFNVHCWLKTTMYYLRQLVNVKSVMGAISSKFPCQSIPLGVSLRIFCLIPVSKLGKCCHMLSLN